MRRKWKKNEVKGNREKYKKNNEKGKLRRGGGV
jgi:hypothetical protein